MTWPRRSLLSAAERIKVRGCGARLHKPVTCENAARLPRGSSGAICGIASSAGSSFAVSTRSALEWLTSRLNWLVPGMTLRDGKTRTRKERWNWKTADFASCASGTAKCLKMSVGFSMRSLWNSMSRSHVGLQRGAPHLNPLPKGEEEDTPALDSRASQRFGIRALWSVGAPLRV